MSVRVVLDVSALRGYAEIDRALAVGELVRLVREDSIDDHVGVPAAAFVSAFTTTGEDGRELLSAIVADAELATMRQDPRQTAFALLALPEADLLHVGTLEVAWPGRGHAVVEAQRHGAVLATFEPCEVDGLTVIDLSASWDEQDEG
ncbi:MAG TPA: hypothetical protein VGF84_10395 [Micromonosporaceae bacterium]